jgi:diguanylate cyclase (GGDEF)-like protein
MGLKSRFILPIMAVFILSYVSVEYYEFKSSLQEKMDQLQRDNHKNFYFLLGLQKDVLKAIAIGVANSSIVKESYYRDDSMIIRDEYESFWKQLREKNLAYELHFFKPPAISFVNFSNFSSIGKDVSDVRSDISWITSSFQDSSHILVCKTFAGVRATYPIIGDNSEVLGGVSIGQNIDKTPDLYKELTGVDGLILYKNDIVKSKMKKKYYNSFLENKLITDEYLITSSTIFGVDEKIVKKLNLSINSQLIEFEEQRYVVNIFPIRDFNNEILGYMVVLNDLTNFYQEFFQKVVENILIMLIVGGLAYWLINRNINSLLRRINLLSSLSQKLHKRSFEALDSIEVKNLEKSKDELNILTYNMVEMGKSLREFYLNLQEIIDEKVMKMKKGIFIDSLTTLRNRKALEDDIKVSPPSMIMILDIDNFSNINNFFGTDIGNLVLKELSAYLFKLASTNSLRLYRVGSDEFGFVVECNNKTEDEIKIRMETILTKTSNIPIGNLPKDLEITIDFTVGVSIGDSASIESADIALHKAKDKKLPFYLYDNDNSSVQEEQKKNLSLLSNIKNGLANDRFTIFFQPIMDKNLKVKKYETLVRLYDGNSYLTPYHFLSYAKKTKYYFDITKVVISKALEKFEGTDTKFSINLSADDITNMEMNLFIEKKIKEFHKPENITFEILESEQIEKIDAILEFIDRVRKYGVKIAIDDFGSGYSNFSYLLTIRPDYLKIDGSLIKGIASDENSYNITKLIVEFAKKSGFSIVAEFVDSEEVLQKGIELDIDLFQGFHLGKPSIDLLQ